MQQPVRGLLTSLFHPEEEPHPPPGQLTGRPHASAADLRQRPKRLSAGDGRQVIEEPAKPISLRRAPSSTQVPSLANGGGLKLSKSAVALPVLSTMGSRSESKAVKAKASQGSKEAAVFDDDDSGSETSSGAGDHPQPTSEALSKLNQLAHHREKNMELKGGKKGSKKKRRSNSSSLNIEVSPEIDEEAMRRDTSRRQGTAVPTSSLSSSHPYAASTSNLPEVGLPQTPRTTRRNMLRDELSESLRQNLLWERQSRNRMLGIGTIQSRNPGSNNMADSRSQSQVAPVSRNHSVLGGGALRPLTTSNSVTNISDQGQRRPNPSQQTSASQNRQYTGDFHHAGW
jgi:hypothetical protein